MKLFSYPVGVDVFGNALQKSLSEASRGSLFRVAVAYISIAAIKKMEKCLKEFIARNGTIEIIVGINIGDEPAKGIQEILRLCGDGSVFMFWSPAGHIFHPKVYCLTNSKMSRGHCWVGSSNFTERGLFKNYECGIQLQVSDKDNPFLIEQINKYFIDLRRSPFCQPVTDALLKPFLEIEKKRKRQDRRQFPMKIPLIVKEKFLGKTVENELGKGFIMLLSHNDVSGKRFEPYFLIPVLARDENPNFWGWDKDFSLSKRGGVPERRVVIKIHLNEEAVAENGRLYYVEKRDEFRFVSRKIYHLGKTHKGSLLHMKRIVDGFDIHVIPSSDTRFAGIVRNAVNLSSNQKKWGYVL